MGLMIAALTRATNSAVCSINDRYAGESMGVMYRHDQVLQPDLFSALPNV